jgi:hypothetical protein
LAPAPLASSSTPNGGFGADTTLSRYHWLSRSSAVATTIGIVINASIFKVPAMVAEALH